MFKIVRVDSDGEKDAMEIERSALQGVENVTLESLSCETEEEIIRAASNANIVTTYAANLTRNVLRALPKCQAIVRYGVGYDSVDVPAATEFGIVVVNVPDFCAEEVSNHVLTFLLASAKKLLLLHKLVRQGKWQEAKALQEPMFPVHGQTLGIIGCGNLGRTVAKKAQSLQLKIIGYDKYVLKDIAEAHGIELVSLDTLLENADFITLHVALTEETYHIMNKETFKKMKRNAILINTSRGCVIDEPALIEVLRDGKIGMACLDVFEEEPLSKESPLLTLENVILTPHSASYSNTSFERLKRSVIAESLRIMQGERPKNIVNKSVIPKIPLL
jgi:D-3-phosphoglycerate dehydrogenase